MIPRACRLVKDSDFKLLAAKGRPFYSSLISLKIYKNNQEKSRFGLVISAKVSKKAVARNTLKRRLAEIIRLNLPKLKPGFDIMIMARPGSAEKKYGEIEQELLELFKKAKIF